MIALYAILAFLLVFIVPTAIAYVHHYKKNKGLPATPTIKQPAEVEGCPFNSFDYVASKLPPAPPGYAFEHIVYTDERGDVLEKLAIIDLSDQKTIKHKTINLSFNEEQQVPWAEYLSTFRIIDRSVYAENSNKLVEFATKYARRIPLPPREEVVRYELNM